MSSPPSLLEKAWLGYNGVVSLGIGLANTLAPFEILQTRIERAGGASVQQLFQSVMAAADAPVVAAAPSPPSPPSSPYAAAVSGSLQSQTAAPLSNNKDAAANLDTLAALVASALFQVQASVANDALIVYLSAVGLSTDSHQERRLVHRALGTVKSSQYAIYIWHELATNGFLSISNVIGLGLCVAATYTWGFVHPPKKTKAIPASKTTPENASKKPLASDEPTKNGSAPY
ncbi:hypothetical protein HDU98_008645 [Podochytrium sp. JEL0797]|nr:hypothetical protein HDU98_008645 [Podochytrium sp. JEL0797]